MRLAAPTNEILSNLMATAKKDDLVRVRELLATGRIKRAIAPRPKLLFWTGNSHSLAVWPIRNSTSLVEQLSTISLIRNERRSSAAAASATLSESSPDLLNDISNGIGALLLGTSASNSRSALRPGRITWIRRVSGFERKIETISPARFRCLLPRKYTLATGSQRSCSRGWTNSMKPETLLPKLTMFSRAENAGSASQCTDNSR